MIYFYTPLPDHKIESLHRRLEYFYKKMFTGTTGTFDRVTLIRAELSEIVEEYETQILNKLKRIFEDYMSLNSTDKETVSRAYYNNNDIEGICNGKCDPVKYDQLPAGIKESLKNLYDNLWDPIMGYKRVEEICGTVKEHFNAFREINAYVVCPFCGLEGLLCEYDDGKDDYDHYIPKGKYPFNCVNFSNLVPMCHNCNSKNKGQIDPVFRDTDCTDRRDLFYPFDNQNHNESIKLKINAETIDLSGNDNWDVSLECPKEIKEKVKSWNEIFRIESRYKATIKKSSKILLKERIRRSYEKKSQKPGFDFEEFRKDIMDSVYDIKEQKNGITDQALYEFLFSNPSFESVLRGQI